MEDERLTKKVDHWDGKCKTNNWSRDVKRILKDIDQPQLWEEGATNLCVKNFLKDAENKLMGKFTNQWTKDLNSQSKLRTYRLFKDNYAVETYVKMNISKGSRSKLAKLRSGTLPLRVETGRFERLEPKDRLCKFCDTNSIETEYHFVFDCPLYLQLRILLLSHILFYPDFCDFEEREKWNVILNDKRIISKTSHYIINAINVRNSVLYKQ